MCSALLDQGNKSIDLKLNLSCLWSRVGKYVMMNRVKWTIYFPRVFQIHAIIAQIHCQDIFQPSHAYNCKNPKCFPQCSYGVLSPSHHEKILATLWYVGYITIHGGNFLRRYLQFWTREFWKVEFLNFFYLLKSTLSPI